MGDDEDEDAGKSSYDYPSRNDYTRHTPFHQQPQSATTTTTSTRRTSLKPPPQSANRASLIDDDSDENDDQGDPYHNDHRNGGGNFGGGAAVIRGNLAGLASNNTKQSATANWGTPVPVNTSAAPALPSVANGRRKMSGINYGMAIPTDDVDDLDMAFPLNEQRNTHTSEQLIRRTAKAAHMEPGPDKKAPPFLSTTAYSPRDPPRQQRHSVGSIEFSDTIARLTAQIDQPDEETLMTQHAQKTLMEIRSTTSGRDLVGEPIHEYTPPATRPNLPTPSEPRKKVSSIFSRRIQKPLEPNTKSSHLRQPCIRETTVDVMTGLASGSLTTTSDQRVACLSCGETLVTPKAVTIVICPKCGDAHPNHRVISQERGERGGRC